MIAAAAVAKPSTELVLKSSEFRRGREESWRELETLIDRIERRGVRSLSTDELQRLPLLYRSTLSSLSVARSIALDRNLLLYLEHLALRSYLCVYGPRDTLRDGIATFLSRGLPAAVRGAALQILIAVIALAAGLGAGFMLTMLDEAWFRALVPLDLADGRGPSSTREELLNKEIFAPWPGFERAFAVMASFLFSHNSGVGILTFSLGIAGGIPTLLLLMYQGAILGAFMALHYNRGLLLDFIGWVSIHGVTELSAIILCGAAGLVIANKLLFPDRYARLDSVAERGQAAAQIVIGAVLLLFVAGILEGGFRQLVASTPLRLTIGLTTGALWLLYFLRGAEWRRR